MRALSRTCPLTHWVLFLGLISVTLAHGDDVDNHMDMSMMDQPELNMTSPSNSTAEAAESYFRHVEYSPLILAHIILMSLAWIVVLPLGIMFSIARSRFSLPTQFGFLLINAVGLMLATFYNFNTPDLYPNNAHHKLGWILTWIVCAQTLMALVRAYAGTKKIESLHEERAAFIPITSEAMIEHQRTQNLDIGHDYRFSNDSGQGTERNTESLRSQSLSSVEEDNENHDNSIRQMYENDEESEKRSSIVGKRIDKFLSKKLPRYLSSRSVRILALIQEMINRTILILGFVALTTGMVTYGGIFRKGEIFSGLAHFIKGGVFFWYGILTLGRWAGCFADLGWAWNLKPSNAIVGARKASFPSAEFIESFLIFFYGSTNVFLEHLGGWGREWTAQDFEHISITIMFFGGGLCGMLIESSRIRDFLNMNITNTLSNRGNESEAAWQPPRTYGLSMNPLPALIVLLLGIMMSSHHQASMVSTMIHAQWGTLLMGAAFARAATYVIFYLVPPTSLLPSRPPSELITAFCLMAGGVIFMASSKDTVAAMEYNNLGAMFVFTIAMGVVTLLMAWIILIIAIKGWALRKEGKPTVFSEVLN